MPNSSHHFELVSTAFFENYQIFFHLDPEAILRILGVRSLTPIDAKLKDFEAAIRQVAQPFIAAMKTIEEILKELGKDVKLARSGTNRWEVKEGSAKIKITYSPENYFIAGDAYLCQLPPDGTKIKPLYQFLLQENYRMNGLVLSCASQNVILSCVIYDLDISKELGADMFNTLFKNADHYDDLLKTQYGCVDRLEEV